MEELKEAGLTSNESRIYVALVELGQTSAGKIASKTGIHRRNVYDALEILIKKGLISYTQKNNKKLYNASNPQRILDIFQEKKNLLTPIIQKLNEKFMFTKEKEEINIYQGKEALKGIFEDQLNYPNIKIIGASPKAYDILQFYFKWYDKNRKQKKIFAEIIAQNRKIKNLPFSEIRYIPKKYENPLSVNLYGDKTCIIFWSSEPLAILIKNKEITDAYKNYFNILWKIAKK
jgi:sugar-specific transcriptional regulator TrmB